MSCGSKWGREKGRKNIKVETYKRRDREAQSESLMGKERSGYGDERIGEVGQCKRLEKI